MSDLGKSLGETIAVIESCVANGGHFLEFVEVRPSTVDKKYNVKISVCTSCKTRFSEFQKVDT